MSETKDIKVEPPLSETKDIKVELPLSETKFTKDELAEAEHIREEEVGEATVTRSLFPIHLALNSQSSHNQCFNSNLIKEYKHEN